MVDMRLELEPLDFISFEVIAVKIKLISDTLVCAV